MSKKANPTYSAPALEKGLDIIELLSKEEIGLTQSEIARSLDRSVGEIFRMLMVLQARGYVAQDPVSDRYSLTTYIFEIAHRIPTIGRLTASAAPLMREVTQKTNQSVHLAILSDESILVVGQTNPSGNNVLSVRLGARIDLWRASSGRVILAYRDEDEVSELIKQVPLPDDYNAEKVRDELAQINAKGFEVRDSFVVKGVVNIAVPIIDHSGRAAAALTMPHIERFGEEITFDQCKEALIETAALLSKNLGGQPAGSS